MKILSIAWKDTLLRFADRIEILFFLVLPLVFTFLLSGGTPEAGFTGIPLPVVDEDGSGLSAQLYASLARSGTALPEAVSRHEAENRYNQESAPAWLLIPSGFETGLLAGRGARLELRRAANNTEADAIERAVLASTGDLERSLQTAEASLAEAERMRPFGSEAERRVYFATSLQAARTAFEAAPERLIMKSPQRASGGYDPATQASAGQMLTWVLVPLLGISGLFAYERQMKTLPRLLSTATHRATYLLGTISGQLVLALVQMSLLIGFSALVLKVNWGNSPAGLGAVILAFGLASVALGTLLGTFAKTEKQASNLSLLLGMLLALLGGCWWPMEMFPVSLQKAALALPTTWAMQGLTDLALRSQGLSQVLPAAGVLLAFAIVFFALALRRFRYE